MIASSKVGHSALNLQPQLRIGSYETAWSMVHKLRRAMVNPQRDLLAIVPKPPESPWPAEDRWEVEVDECLVGGKEKGVSGRETRTKSLVVVAVEVRGAADPISGFRHMGRVRLARIPAADEPNLIDFIEDVVAPGAIVNTDGWSGYHNLETASLFGYRHVVDNLSAKARENPDDPKMPNVYRVIGNLKRVLIGTHWGSVRPKQLDYYLDEVTFRWNRHGAKSRGLLFFRLIELAAQTSAVTCEQIVVSMPPQDAVQIRNLLYDSDLRHWFLRGWGLMPCSASRAESMATWTCSCRRARWPMSSASSGAGNGSRWPTGRLGVGSGSWTARPVNWCGRNRGRRSRPTSSRSLTRAAGGWTCTRSTSDPRSRLKPARTVSDTRTPSRGWRASARLSARPSIA